VIGFNGNKIDRPWRECYFDDAGLLCFLQDLTEEGNMKVSYLLALLAVFLLFACAGEPAATPEKEPEKEPEKPQSEVPAPEEELAKAKELRDLILEYGLDKAAAEEFDSAENHFKEGESAYGKDNDAAKASLEEAIEGYRAVIRAGYEEISRKLKNDVEAIKKEADDLKASVALPEEYETADGAYKKALDREKAEEYETALAGYSLAISLFRNVRDRSLEKKLRAEKSLEEAKAGIADVEETAKEIEEEEKQGGAQ
jgi:hypothetical protein